mgnify:CR=1 FL=1
MGSGTLLPSPPTLLSVSRPQLNPNGTLNHKYTAEIAVRSSGYPYTVVRSTGMIDSMEGGPFLPDADQVRAEEAACVVRGHTEGNTEELCAQSAR